MFEQDTIETLEKKILFWSNKLSSCKNPVEASVLNNKILEAKAKITELRNQTPKVKVVDCIDTAVIADNKREMARRENQYISSGNIFQVQLF